MFAQPSGLASDGTHLYVADSEGSAIRKLPLVGEGRVETLVGTPNTFGALFNFGDKDGTGPLGAKLWVNHDLDLRVSNEFDFSLLHEWKAKKFSFATGYTYAGMGWTTVNEAAVPIP